MVSAESIMGIINARLSRVLLIAQASLSEHQFKAFRTLVLDQFGRSGLTSELEELLKSERKDRQG
jgi:hypothetical protein